MFSAGAGRGVCERMFESLSDKLKRALKNLRGEGVLTPEHVDAALREIRLALLEADVNYKVAKDFIASATKRISTGFVSDLIWTSSAINSSSMCRRPAVSISSVS